MFLDSLRTLSFKYVKCIIPSNLTYLFILKSYYHLKVLYHTIPPFAMDLRQKETEISCCTSLMIRDYLQGQVILQRVYLTDITNVDGGMVLMKLPWMKFYFLNLSRVGEVKQHNQIVVAMMACTYFQNETWTAVCKSLLLHGDALEIWNGANL